MMKRKLRPCVNIADGTPKKLLLEINAKNDTIMEEWISRLPDDVLVNILSRLNVREAARTGVFSHRWKYLWTFITSLNFDASMELLNLNTRPETLKQERIKYLNWVNKALASHGGSNINDFRVCFDLQDDHEKIITYWIHNAILKMRVKEFELNLHHYNPKYTAVSNELYWFPNQIYSYLKSPHGLKSIGNLTSLDLNTVNVSGEILEFFLCSCPLEKLRVGFSMNLRILKVVGSSIKLKYLEIYRCHFIHEIKISAPSLVSFSFNGLEIELNIENVPQLVHVSLGGRQSTINGPSRSYLPRLETLEVDLFARGCSKFMPCRSPKLTHLTLNVSAFGALSLVGLPYVINACPYIQKLTLKLQFDCPKERKMRRFRAAPHKHLKVVELIRFGGHPIDVEFAIYLFENATVLERLVVEPLLGNHQSLSEARQHALKMLETMVPESVELVIR